VIHTYNVAFTKAINRWRFFISKWYSDVSFTRWLV